MPTQTIRGRVPKAMMPMYQALLDRGYKPSEIAREGIRALYSQTNIQPKEATI